jgi:hypothetical protein
VKLKLILIAILGFPAPLVNGAPQRHIDTRCPQSAEAAAPACSGRFKRRPRIKPAIPLTESAGRPGNPRLHTGRR